MPKHRVARAETLRSIAELYYQTVEAAEALARSNNLRESATLKPGTDLTLPARLMGYGGVSERGEMRSVVEMVLYERRKDLIFISVQENIYPDQMVPISGKCLYVVSDGAIVVRADALAVEDWDVDNLVFGGRRQVADATIPLLTGRSYSFYLAPYQLSPNAEQYLCDHVSECVTASHLDSPTQDSLTFVRDAYLWSLDLHHKLYMPALRAWQEWVMDDERATRLFIASSLKCMIDQKDIGWLYDSTDPMDIRDQLNPGEPKRYLEQVYGKNELAQRIKAEQAMALLAELIDSVDFRTLERSAIDSGGQQLEVSLIIWAGVLECAMESQPGRELTRELIGADTRIPVAYLLSDAPPDNSPEFSQIRYLLNAALAIMKDLAPAWVALHNVNNKVEPLRHFARYLERVAGQAPLVGNYRKMHENSKRGRPLTHKLANPQKTLQRLSIKSNLPAAHAAARPPAWLLRSERLSGAYARNFELAHTSLRAVVEAVNLSTGVVEALNELATPDGTSGKQVGRKLMGAIGGLADFGAMVAESVEVFVAQASKQTVKRAAAGLGIASGICDFIEFALQMHEASGKRDYNASVGLGAAAIGSAMIAVGSTVALAGTMGASAGAIAAGTSVAEAAIAGASAGSVMGIIGAAIVGAGALGARLCMDNSYEEFAKVCFLGKDHGMAPRDWGWASTALPTKSLKNELSAMVQLISTFRIGFEDDGGLTITPGFFRAGDVFEVYIEHRYQTHEPNAAFIEVDLHSGEVQQLHGVEPLADDSRVYREDGRVSLVWISERIAHPPQSARLRMVDLRLARVRLRMTEGGRFVPPVTKRLPTDQWVQVESAIGVLGPNWRSATSTDESRRANPKTQPFLEMRSL